MKAKLYVRDSFARNLRLRVQAEMLDGTGALLPSSTVTLFRGIGPGGDHPLDAEFTEDLSLAVRAGDTRLGETLDTSQLPLSYLGAILNRLNAGTPRSKPSRAWRRPAPARPWNTPASAEPAHGEPDPHLQFRAGQIAAARGT